MVQLWEENGQSELTVEQHWGHGHWDREKGSFEKLLMQLWPKTSPRENTSDATFKTIPVHAVHINI